MAQALRYQAVKMGLVVLYRSIFDLVKQLVRDQAFEGENRILAKFLKADLLIIDDMGLKVLPRQSGEYLFEIIMRRYETNSTVMTSNRPLEDWGKLTGDVVIEGPVGNLRTMGPVAGDLAILGDARNLRIGGHLGSEGGSALILGDVGTLSLASRTSRSDLLSDLDIFGTVRSLTVGARRFGGNVEGDVHVWGDHAGMFQVAGSVEGDVQIDGDLRTGRVSGDVWGMVQVFGDVNRLSTGLICDALYIAGDLRSLATSSSLAAGTAPVDYDCLNAGPEPDGALIVLGEIGRVRQV